MIFFGLVRCVIRSDSYSLFSVRIKIWIGVEVFFTLKPWKPWIFTLEPLDWNWGVLNKFNQTNFKQYCNPNWKNRKEIFIIFFLYFFPKFSFTTLTKTCLLLLSIKLGAKKMRKTVFRWNCIAYSYMRKNLSRASESNHQVCYQATNFHALWNLCNYFADKLLKWKS